jgi:FkbM family methyltransferase
MIQKLFALAVKPLVGSGIGRIKPLANLYQRIAMKVIPKEKILDVQGFKMKVVTEGHINDIATELLFKGIHEPMSTYIFKRYVKEGDCVVDIGANVGYFSLLSARLVGSTGRVYAFEPDTDNMKALFENVVLNHFQNVGYYQVALSDYVGRSKFYLSKTESARHSLIQTHEHSSEVIVEVNKLDEIIPQSFPVHFIKTDTEGAELCVLRGAKDIIRRNYNIKVLLEVYPEALAMQNVTVVDLWNYITNLSDLNFSHIYLVDDYRDSIQKITLYKLLKYFKENSLACNLLCSRKELKLLR